MQNVLKQTPSYIHFKYSVWSCTLGDRQDGISRSRTQILLITCSHKVTQNYTTSSVSNKQQKRDMWFVRLSVEPRSICEAILKWITGRFIEKIWTGPNCLRVVYSGGGETSGYIKQHLFKSWLISTSNRRLCARIQKGKEYSHLFVLIITAFWLCKVEIFSPYNIRTGRPGFESLQDKGKGIFVPSTASRLALRHS
jgi:hypothetical protein